MNSLTKLLSGTNESQPRKIDLSDIRNPVLEKSSAIARGKYTLYSTGHIDPLLSKLGPVFPYLINNKTGKKQKAMLWGNGADYRYWLLKENNTNYTYNCHTLVASAFIINDDPERKKLVLHLNHRKFDFRVSNLKWGTWSENNAFKKPGNIAKAREQEIINKAYIN